VTQPAAPERKGFSPIKSSDLPDAPYHRLLVYGAPKDGKTYTTGSTAEGPVFVINSDDKYSLQGLKDAGHSFETAFISGDNPQRMFDCIAFLREETKKGTYKSVIWDTASKYSWRALKVYEDATRNAKGESDGRRYWQQHRNHILSVVDGLINLDAHIIVNAHYKREFGALVEGQAEKTGEGIVADMPGELRMVFARDFQNVVFLQVNHQGKREFLWNMRGVWGPGGRTLPKDTSSFEPNVAGLWAAIQGRKKG